MSWFSSEPAWVPLPEAFATLDKSPIEMLFQKGQVRFRVQYVHPPPSEFAGMAQEGGDTGHLFFVHEDDLPRAASLLFHFWEVRLEDPDADPGSFTGTCECCGTAVVAVEVCPECELRLVHRAQETAWTRWFRELGVGD